ncbi:MAG: DNA-processing protein DprA [Cruoricaptor ignavus]|nr:DNA-processing protein DprA [Cruoricaptor ignavus]
MFSEEHLFSIALRKCALIGDINFKKVVEAEGSAENVWKLPKSTLQKIFGIGDKISREIGNPEYLAFAEKELMFCEKNNITIRLRHKNELPNLLQDCYDAPSILYQKGTFNENKTPISIVGTRKYTSYGRTFINDFLEEIKTAEIQTISGLALGTDAEVHQKSLEKNIPTVGVLAHGFHTFYPAKNKPLSEKILENGGTLFTEFTTADKPDREHFIQRNRIVAGLSPATIVVETPFGGGSISTVSFANGYNRDVFALPGKITDVCSQGCNLLIYQNKAATISSIKDLIKELGINEPNAKVGELFPKSEIKPKLTEEQHNIYNTIKEHPQISLDDISEKCNLPAYKILPILLEMEISGYIQSFSGRQFQVM